MAAMQIVFRAEQSGFSVQQGRGMIDAGSSFQHFSQAFNVKACRYLEKASAHSSNFPDTIELKASADFGSEVDRVKFEVFQLGQNEEPGPLERMRIAEFWATADDAEELGIMLQQSAALLKQRKKEREALPV